MSLLSAPLVDGDFPALLAVYLHYQIHRVAGNRARVVAGPGGVHQFIAVSECLPEIVTDVGHDGRQHPHDGFQAFPGRQRVPRPSYP